MSDSDSSSEETPASEANVTPQIAESTRASFKRGGFVKKAVSKAAESIAQFNGNNLVSTYRGQSLSMFTTKYTKFRYFIPKYICFQQREKTDLRV